MQSHDGTQHMGACVAGLVPNIWWKAVSIDQLRSHPSYAALPAAPPPLHPSTYRSAASHIAAQMALDSLVKCHGLAS